MLQQLRNVQIDRLDIDEAVALVAFGRHLANTYAEFNLETPEWLTDNLGVLQTEIKTRRADAIAKELKEIDSREAALKTNVEKRSELAAKRKRLQGEMSKLKGRVA